MDFNVKHKTIKLLQKKQNKTKKQKKKKKKKTRRKSLDPRTSQRIGNKIMTHERTIGKLNLCKIKTFALF